jgi:16S rRNA (cytosine1402-N4)-methyltransferase
MTEKHIPVLADSVTQIAAVQPGEVWVDCTLGFAGHTRRLLDAGASVYGIDQDADARAAAAANLSDYGDRIRIVAGNFGDLDTLLESQGVDTVDGILADIGVSSFQLDTSIRGFSFRRPGPVDMRMNQDSGETAQALIERLPTRELARILRRFGEEPFAGPIARAMQAWAQGSGPHDTVTLATTIADTLPQKVRAKLKHHPATRSFQALRIAVNDELGALERLLDAIPNCLGTGGRALIISFHSLEDWLVKSRFNRWAGRNIAPGPGGRTLPVAASPTFDLLTRKPAIATPNECDANPRSRTARLRAVRKLGTAA